jgi:hypothetical protein
MSKSSRENGLHTAVRPGKVPKSHMNCSVVRSIATRRGRAWFPPVALLSATVVAAACGYTTNPKSSANVTTDTLVAWAYNGTGSVQPAGYYLAENRVVPITSAVTFDVAFDIDSATGMTTVWPVRLITDGSVSALHVGLQRFTTSFDSTTFALRTGYQFDSVYTLAPGQGLIIVSNPPGCATDPNPTLYGKFVIDSVNTRTRTIHFRATEDPNCGYRSFAKGIPSF